MQISKHISVFLINAAWIGFISATVCPYEAPCTCEKYTVSCSNLQEMPVLLTGDNVTAVTSVKFKGGNITNIPDNSLPPGLTGIAFTDLPLTKISNNAFLNSTDTLQAIDFTRIDLTGLPQALLRLGNLTSLTVTEVDFDNWDKNILTHLGGSLEELSLEKLNLTSWPMWIQQLTSLRVIAITDSPITSVPEDAFQSIEKTLEELYLDNTNQTDIPSTANLVELNTLFLTNNHISTISSNKLSPSIKNLNLQYNNIKEITDTSFSNDFLLDTLELDYNPISKITDSAFKNLKQLTKLSLSMTSLIDFPLALTSLTNLTRLSMISYTPFPCPCPPKQELVQWYEAYNGSLQLNAECADFVQYRVYLNGILCRNTTAAVTTTVSATKGNNSAVRVASNTYYGYLCFILILAVLLGQLYFNLS